MKDVTIASLMKEPKDIYDALEKIGLSKKNISYVKKAELIIRGKDITILVRWPVKPTNLIPLEDY